MSSSMRDRILGCFLAIGGAILLGYLIPVSVVVPEDIKSVALSPNLWPRVIAGFFLLAGLGLLVSSFIQSRKPDDVANADEGVDAESIPDKDRRKREAIGILFLFAYFGLIEILGIPVSSAIAITAFSLLYGERKYLIVLSVAFATPAALYLFFTYVAGIPIPLGLFDR